MPNTSALSTTTKASPIGLDSLSIALMNAVIVDVTTVLRLLVVYFSIPSSHKARSGVQLVVPPRHVAFGSLATTRA